MTEPLTCHKGHRRYVGGMQQPGDPHARITVPGTTERMTQ